MRIAHISDLHVLNLDGAIPHRLFNKRLTGYLNLRFKRGAIHKAFVLSAVARAIREAKVDHVVVTGDLSNLALQGELADARRFLDEELGMDPRDVSVVPGNHDAYTRGAYESARFQKAFAPYVTSDLPEFSGASGFPFVRLRSAGGTDVAIVGLSTARPRPPLVASGSLGKEQLDALSRAIGHADVKDRAVVVLQHHPIHNPPSFAKRLLEGLSDAAEETLILGRLQRGLLLHGHLHRRIHRRITAQDGHIEAIGATSASLIHDQSERMGGFNIYDVAKDGTVVVSSQRLDPKNDRFEPVDVRFHG
jgi:3',5'-cyclic AMP phosphodiesterase CpdA